MTDWTKYVYTVGSHFLSALINGDVTGLSDEEERELDEWVESLGHGEGHWCTTDEHDEFGLCDVTGSRGQVEQVIYYEVLPDVPA